jgi:hypothetical protein
MFNQKDSKPFSDSQKTSSVTWAVIIFAFIVWLFLFRGFLLNHLSLQSDALAYYEHFEYFVKNLSRGVYPLWEPVLLDGMPMEFYLRRIGSFNPFYLVMVIVHKIGVPFLTLYPWFLAAYYFLGMLGFYHLANRIFHDQRFALTAFLLLLFSSLGSRLFDSYLLLTIIPLIWFFYFLVAFFQKPNRADWLGIVFTTMLLVTTYLPFYFALILISFIVFFSIVYFKQAWESVQKLWDFTRRHFMLIVLSVFLVGISLVPGILFFLEGKQGEFIMPMRGGIMPDQGHVMQVSKELVETWEILEDVLFSFHFWDVRLFQFAVLYVPIFSVFLFFLGLINQVSRKLVFLGVWLVGFFLIVSTHGPFYGFLYDQVSFFKYFRNVHFFLWMVLLPVFVLFVTEQLSIFIKQQGGGLLSKPVKLTMVVIFTLGFFFWSLKNNPSSWISVATILMCGTFLCALLSRLSKRVIQQRLFITLVSALIILQPFEVYYYLSKNSDKFVKAYRYYGKTPYWTLMLPSEDEKQQLLIQLKSCSGTMSPRAGAYSSLFWNSFLRDNLDPRVFDYYAALKILVYDKVQVVDRKEFDFENFKETFTKLRNQAYVFSAEDSVVMPEPDGASVEADSISSADERMQVKEYSVNKVKLTTNFDDNKFLVYTDNYHSSWRAYLDGKRIKLWQANIAFKGVGVPAGQHVLEFKFGEPWKIAFNYLLLFAFSATLAGLIVLLVREKKGTPC